MKRPLLFFTLALLLLPASARASGVPGVDIALPPHARITAALPLKGGGDAVGYVAGHPYIGLIREAGGKLTLVWRHRLPERARKLEARGGGIVGIAYNGSRTQFSAFAYSFHLGVGRSAIVASSTGIVTANQQARLTARGFVVRNGDLAHPGSVRYSIVTNYQRHAGLYRVVRSIRTPDYTAANLPMPSAEVHTVQGDTILLRLEIADTEQERETGLMNRATLDPDSGMIFVWPAPIIESFYMKDTYVPLTVGFVSSSGTLQETQDMEPLTLDLHTPAMPYQYAIEVNQGWFAANGINIGDHLTLNLPVGEVPSPLG